MKHEDPAAKILIGGDVCPIGRNLSLFRQGDASGLLNDLLQEFENADLSVVNLECPLIKVESPIEKRGPVLGAQVECASALRAAKINVANLANNHVMDHGEEGLLTTIEALEQNGISYVGAGNNLDAARNILIHEIRGIRIGILGVAEHEFGIAEKDAPGSNPLDMIDFVRNVRQGRAGYDFLLVLVHGGNEHYQYPRPQLMDMCRFLVEEGANAVICQHSHCAGCMETYREAPILYGQGNLVFDLPSTYRSWHEGILVSLEIDGRLNTRVKLIPYYQSDGRVGAHGMTVDQKTAFLREFWARSKSIGDETFVKDQWKRFCEERKRFYLHALHGEPTFLRRLAGKFDLLHYFESPTVQRTRLNLIRCESHREALITILSMESARQR